MKISIAMATCNGGRFISQQLESFAEQVRKPDEVIITDDCSSDDTVEIIQRFSERARFPVIWEKNERQLGYAGNFNKALMRATGDLVLLSDQDDVWFPEKIQRIEQEAKKRSALVIMNDAALTDSDLIDVGLTKLGQIRSLGLSERSFVMGCCAGIKRELLDLCLPIPDGCPAHDGWIIKFADGMKRKHVIPEVLQWYRRHESNESQAIANRTSKLPLWRVLRYISTARSVYGSGDVTEKARKHLHYFELQIQTARRAARRVENPYAVELLAMVEDWEDEYELRSARLLIRTRRRSERLVSVVKLWIKGGYDRFSGLKSALKDLIIP